MLTKRTNILFDNDLWNLLTTVAEKEKSSVGEIVRRAVKKVYTEQDFKQKRLDAWKTILRVRPKPFLGKIDYKVLINYGRKY